MAITDRLKRWLMTNDDRELVEAIKHNDPARVFALLSHGADVNARDGDGQTPLFWAGAAYTDPAIAKQLLDRGANVRERDMTGETPLHTAANVGDEARIALFLDRGAEIDARDAAGWTPLHCAAFRGRLDEVTLLVSRGANVGLRDVAGNTPLDLAWEHCSQQEPLPEQRWVALERLLGGFMTARVVDAPPDSLIMQVQTLHLSYPEAEREAKAHGTLTIPRAILREAPEPGDLIVCQKGLSPVLDEAWRHAHKRDLDIERER